MHWNLLIWTMGLIFSGCVSGGSNSRMGRHSEDSRENVRLAQAQIVAGEGTSAVKGTLNFEQMPNSVIVTYHIEGLAPKRDYQILLQENQDCSSIDLTTAFSLKALRANKMGISENTFKTVEFSVSGDPALLGRSIVIVRRPTQVAAGAPVACGSVEPLSLSGAMN